MAKSERNIVKVVNDHGPLGWLLFTAYIGAAVYFFDLDPNFWGFILALIKAAFWPAFVLYHGLGALGVS
jgi:hypothetical protein